MNGFGFTGRGAGKERLKINFYIYPSDDKDDQELTTTKHELNLPTSRYVPSVNNAMIHTQA